MQRQPSRTLATARRVGVERQQPLHERRRRSRFRERGEDAAAAAAAAAAARVLLVVFLRTVGRRLGEAELEEGGSATGDREERPVGSARALAVGVVCAPSRLHRRAEERASAVRRADLGEAHHPLKRADRRRSWGGRRRRAGGGRAVAVGRADNRVGRRARFERVLEVELGPRRRSSVRAHVTCVRERARAHERERERERRQRERGRGRERARARARARPRARESVNREPLPPCRPITRASHARTNTATKPTTVDGRPSPSHLEVVDDTLHNDA